MRWKTPQFGIDEKGIKYSQQFECQTSFISDIWEVFSVLVNQQLITEIFPLKAKAVLHCTSDINKMCQMTR